MTPPVPPFARVYCQRYGAFSDVSVISETLASPPSFLMTVRAGSIQRAIYDFRECLSSMFHGKRDCPISDSREKGPMDLVAEIRRAFKDRPEKTKGGLAKKLGKHQNVVTYILKGERQIKANEVPIIRKYLELDPVVPIVGTVGASAEAYFYGEASDNPAEVVQAPQGASPDTVAVEIRGESLGAGFNGWLAFYDDRREPITSDLIGRLCVVSLPDGRVLIKIPKKAKAKGLFHLFSNIGGEPIPDVEIDWAALVKLIAPKS